MDITKSHRKTVLVLAAAAALAAVLRFFMKGLVEPLGVPTIVGSLLASLTVVLAIGIVLIFHREAQKPEGRYIKASAWFLILAVWCEVLTIAGILATERAGADTYYMGPWQTVKEVFPSPAAHALGHTRGFFFRTLLALVLGAVVYGLGKRSRAASPGT